MIYVLYGSDSEKSREKIHSLVNSLVAKKPDATRTRLTDETFSTEGFDELIGGQGLFASRLIVELDGVFANAEAKEFLLDNLDQLAESENIFIFREGKLLVKELKAFEKHAEKVQEFALKEVSPEEKPNLFALADALGSRDKKRLWILYTLEKRNGGVDEELHGLLFWQVKSMLLAAQSQTAEQAGLKPFVFGKAKRFSTNFSPEELNELSSCLISIYHQAHRGGLDLGARLEQWILGL